MPRPKTTIEELLARAKGIADQRPWNSIAFAVAEENFQIIGNVAHMYWFRVAIAVELTKRQKKWAHLQEEAEKILPRGRRHV